MSEPQADYDAMAAGYAAARRSDPRIQAAIDAALGDAATVVNIGAGTGSYEPRGRTVVAVEPSPEMIAHRLPGAAPVVQATAEALPFADGEFDAAMAVLTIHHWRDQDRGLAEMRRVAPRRVILTWDPDAGEGFWLAPDYLPELLDLDRPRFRPTQELLASLGGGTLDAVRIPHDCADGFLAAYWRRPEAYLDPAVRAGISSFAVLDATTVARALRRLAADLANGAFWERHADLRDAESFDAGYRLLTGGA